MSICISSESAPWFTAALLHLRWNKVVQQLFNKIGFKIISHIKKNSARHCHSENASYVQDDALCTLTPLVIRTEKDRMSWFKWEENAETSHVGKKDY